MRNLHLFFRREIYLAEQKKINIFQKLSIEFIKKSERGGTTVSARALDEQLKDVPITYIKMDIEGAELEALRGAERILKRYRPQLAICVYHKPDDIYEIPQYLHSIVPEYRFCLRNYSFCAYETVLYATIP